MSCHLEYLVLHMKTLLRISCTRAPAFALCAVPSRKDFLEANLVLGKIWNTEAPVWPGQGSQRVEDVLGEAAAWNQQVACQRWYEREAIYSDGGSL